MHEIYELRDKLCKELKKYGSEEVTNNNLPVIDSLSHAIKNIDKIIDKYEEEEYNKPNRYYGRGRGRDAKRDSMGRYASDGHSHIVHKLREMMTDAPNDEIRREYEKIISHYESM